MLILELPQTPRLCGLNIGLRSPHLLHLGSTCSIVRHMLIQELISWWWLFSILRWEWCWLCEMQSTPACCLKAHLWVWAVYVNFDTWMWDTDTTTASKSWVTAESTWSTSLAFKRRPSARGTIRRLPQTLHQMTVIKPSSLSGTRLVLSTLAERRMDKEHWGEDEGVEMEVEDNQWLISVSVWLLVLSNTASKLKYDVCMVRLSKPWTRWNFTFTYSAAFILSLQRAYALVRFWHNRKHT